MPKLNADDRAGVIAGMGPPCVTVQALIRLFEQA